MNGPPNESREEIERLPELNKMKLEMFEDQIRKLAGLHDEGLLTDEEFSAKKAELLSRL